MRRSPKFQGRGDEHCPLELLPWRSWGTFFLFFKIKPSVRTKNLQNLPKIWNSHWNYWFMIYETFLSLVAIQGHGRTVENVREAGQLRFECPYVSIMILVSPGVVFSAQAVKQRPDKPVAILLDTKAGAFVTWKATSRLSRHVATQGPEIRTGFFKDVWGG